MLQNKFSFTKVNYKSHNCVFRSSLKQLIKKTLQYNASNGLEICTQYNKNNCPRIFLVRYAFSPSDVQIKMSSVSA